MKNLDKLIDQWIGEEKIPNPNIDDPKIQALSICNSIGYNAKIQDLKSRKQELIKCITEALLEQFNKYDWGYYDPQGIIKELTGK